MSTAPDPHAGQPVMRLGPEPDAARLSAILLHGRGASAEDILGLAEEFAVDDVSYLAPQAAGHTWYPYSFLSPIPKNEPFLTSALGVVAGLVHWLEEQGVPADRVAVLGFSQGGCLTLEFAGPNSPRNRAILR